MFNNKAHISIPDIPTKHSSLPGFIFEKFLQGTANAKIDNKENFTNPVLAESQKKKYPCPLSIDKILDRDSYAPTVFLDDLISAANSQATGQWLNGKKHYIEAGGWILLSPDGSQFHYRVKPVETQDYSTGIYMNDQEVQKYVGDYLKKGWLIIAEFHTHPNSGNTTDDQDAALADSRQIPGFIIDTNGQTFKYGSCEKGIYGIGIPKGCK